MEYEKKSFIMDMDGVIFVGNKIIDGAKQFIEKLKENGSKYLFLTNNSSQTPLDLSKKLLVLGIDVTPERIHTAAQAVASFIESQKKGGSAYVIGDQGIFNALHDVGYHITEFNPDYVIMGDTRTYSLEMIQKACKFVNGGARLIGTNPDLTGPSDFGIVPSVGSLIAPIEKATGVKPYYIGKPNPLIMRTALRKIDSHSEDTVMIGDRMDTDIVAGIETGLETILVLTGVTRREEVERFPYQPTRICNSIKDVWV